MFNWVLNIPLPKVKRTTVLQTSTIVRQLGRQHLPTIFITNNHPLFHLCRNKKLVKRLIKRYGDVRMN